MSQINDKQLLLNLIQLLPKNINKFSEKLISNEIISEPIIYLKESVEQFVINDIILKSDSIYENNESFDGKKLQEISLKCEAIIDIIWEKINCCQWNQVVIDFRYIFGYISLIKCFLKIYENIYCFNNYINCFDNKIKALNALDFGLLMSPPIGGNILAKFAQIIHNSIVEQEFNDQIDGKLESRNVSKRKLSDYEINNSFVSKSYKLDKNECNQQIVDQKVDENELNENNEINLDLIIPYFNRNNDKNSIIRVKDLDLETFREQYLKKKIPVIITDCMNDWPAISSRKWSIDYILKVAAFRTVPIEIGSKYTDEEWTQKLMTIKEFVNKYILNTESKQIGYLAQHNLFEQIEELSHDFYIPEYCSLTEEDINVDINAWFGPKLTVSPLHFDPKDNLLAQVMGNKYIRLYSSETDSQSIYPNECKLLCNTSQVDLENVNEVKFALFNKIDNFYECILKEGEMLFIPKKYWHFVKSLTTSFSISFWWK